MTDSPPPPRFSEGDLLRSKVSDSLRESPRRRGDRLRDLAPPPLSRDLDRLSRGLRERDRLRFEDRLGGLCDYQD